MDCWLVFTFKNRVAEAVGICRPKPATHERDARSTSAMINIVNSSILYVRR